VELEEAGSKEPEGADGEEPELASSEDWGLGSWRLGSCAGICSCVVTFPGVVRLPSEVLCFEEYSLELNCSSFSKARQLNFCAETRELGFCKEVRRFGTC